MAGTIEALVPRRAGHPGPPLGPELGPTPVDVQDVVAQINDETAAFDGMEVPVTVESTTTTAPSRSRSASRRRPN